MPRAGEYPDLEVESAEIDSSRVRKRRKIAVPSSNQSTTLRPGSSKTLQSTNHDEVNPFHPSRPSTPVRSQEISVISPHTRRWLDQQLIDNPAELGVKQWEQLQINAGEGEVEDHTRRLLDEGDLEDEIDWENEDLEIQNPVDFSEDLHYLLNNGRFIFGGDELYPTTSTPTIPDHQSVSASTIAATQTLPPATSNVSTILQSRLRVTDPDLDPSISSDSDSDDSMINIRSYASTHREPKDQVVGVPEHRSKYEISDFALGIAIWCEVKGITRLDYASLREVLKLGDMDIEKELPQRLSTLLSWSRQRLPLPPLLKAKVPIKIDTMPSNTSGSSTNMYHFDPRFLVAMLLSAPKTQERMHFGMADIVDSPSQLWHANCWASSMRTCSSDFAAYADGEPIFPSDIVRFRGLRHGRVLSFGRDQRATSNNLGKVILRVQKIVAKSSLSPTPTQVAQDPHELILVEDGITEVLARDVTKASNIALERTFETVFASAKIRKVYNTNLKQFRSVDKLAAIRAELEIEYYGRDALTQKLRSGIRSLPFTCFIDDFGLYRNMYRTLTGIYLTPASLNLQDRQRTRNVYPITLGPHGSTLNDVVRPLQRGFRLIEEGCALRVNGVEVEVWAPIIAFTGDMKSQQEAAGFLGPTATLSCRMCYADKRTRDDMEYDVVNNGRYHHETLNIRAKCVGMSKTARKEHLRQHGMAAEPSALQSLTPALDIISSRPGDPAHSEFAGIVRRIMPHLLKWILQPKAVDTFTARFRAFPLAPGWGRIQSPATHLKSWSMSECARASCIVPLLLRLWPLKNAHIRPDYRAELTKKCEARSGWGACDWVIFYLAKIAKSNSLVAASSLTVQDRAQLQSTIIEARKGFLLLMNAGEVLRGKAASEAKSRKARKKTQASQPPTPRRRQRRVTPASDTMSQTSEASSINENEGEEDDQDQVIPEGPFQMTEAKLAALPNVHTALHFPFLNSEYGLLWLVNALPGERMHKVFKAAVLSTNHRKVERQLLLKSCVQTIIRLAYDGAFNYSDPKLAASIKLLGQRCPTLFQELVSALGETSAQERGQNQQYIGDAGHLNPLVLGKMAGKSLDMESLPRKMSDIAVTNPFFTALKTGMISYGHNTYSLGAKPIYWYNQFSFLDPTLSQRTSLHTGHFIQLAGLRYPHQPFAEIMRVFTHCFTRDTERRIFAMVKLLRAMDEKDQLLEIPILEYTEQEATVGISEISSKRAWIVPFKTEMGGSTDGRLLHCNWDVQFS